MSQKFSMGFIAREFLGHFNTLAVLPLTTALRSYQYGMERYHAEKFNRC